MESNITQNHWLDDNGRPMGGTTFGQGFAIGWQNGPLSDGVNRREPNGAFVEHVIEAVIGRIEYYEASGFGCQENRDALNHLDAALHLLQMRTARRVAGGVEGSHGMTEGDDAHYDRSV